MFIISNASMLISCARAGILGVIPSLNGRTHDDFRAILKEVRQATDLPFGVNLTIGLTDPQRIQADLEACIEFEVPVLVTSYGNPTPIVHVAHQHNMTVLHDVIHLKHALKAKQAGVDGIIGVCAGAGGHGGTFNPYAFLPLLKEELKIPIIAAGCISTGDHMVASLSLGADLCYMGSRFIASTECDAQMQYKSSVVDAGLDDIVYTDSVSGVYANFLKSTLPETGPRTRESPHKKWKDIWSAGQGVAQIQSIESIEMIVNTMVDQYHQRLELLKALSPS
jgi:nitronate monooxygenase